MSNPIAKHADGSNCYTKNCSRGGGHTPINNGLNKEAFIAEIEAVDQAKQLNNGYDLTGEVRIVDSVPTYRIRATKDFPEFDIKKGDKGGWIESPLLPDGSPRIKDGAFVGGDALIAGNASIAGNVLVAEEAYVGGNATIYGNAIVSGQAVIAGNAKIGGATQVKGNAVIAGNAIAEGDASIMGQATVGEEAIVKGGLIYQASRVRGYARINGGYVIGSEVRGNAIVNGGMLRGGMVEGNATIWGGYVDERAHVYGEATVSDGAQIGGTAQVFGNAKVRQQAKVTGTAQVFGDAIIAGSSWIHEGEYRNGLKSEAREHGHSEWE